MKLGHFLQANGAGSLSLVAVDWLESRYGGADAARLARVVNRIIPPSASVVEGTPETARLFGGIDATPAFFLYDRTGTLIWSGGGASDQQGRVTIDEAILKRAISAR